MTPPSKSKHSKARQAESGNVIFFILLAVVLVGLVTVAIRSGDEGANIDKETIIIRVSEMRQYVSDIERGLRFIMQDGASEAEIRFAHPDANPAYGAIADTPTRQLFNDTGGGVQYRLPPTDITSDSWEFYGNTRIPGVGTDNPELIAVLPNVTTAFCTKINEMNGHTGQPAEDAGCSIHDTGLRFTSGTLFQDGTENTLNEASFTVTPAVQACVQCAAGPTYHFYHVLMAR